MTNHKLFYGVILFTAFLFFAASFLTPAIAATNSQDSGNNFASVNGKASPDEDKPKKKPKSDTPKKSEPVKQKSEPTPKSPPPKRETPKQETPKYDKPRNEPKPQPQPKYEPAPPPVRQRNNNQEKQNKYKEEYDRANNPYTIPETKPKNEDEQYRQRVRNEAKQRGSSPGITPVKNESLVPHQPVPVLPKHETDYRYRIDDYTEFTRSEVIYQTALQVTSEPSGALVTWNANFKGYTPLMITNFQKGSGILVVKMEGCDSFREHVMLRPDETTIIHVNLPCESGRMEITTYPHFARVHVDGEYVGTFSGTPVVVNNVTPGYHEVRAELENYNDAVKIVNVYSGRTVTVPLMLSPTGVSGAIYIESSPPGGDIYIDGEYTGLITPATITNLLPGTYWVSVRKIGSGDGSKVALVQVGLTTEVYLQLNDQYVTGPVYNNQREIYFPYDYGLETSRDYYPVYNIPPMIDDNDYEFERKTSGTWMYTIGGSGLEEAHDAVPTWDGGYLIAGHQEYDNERDAWIVKTTSQGRVLWARSLHARGFDNITSIALDADSGFVVAGYTSKNELDESGDISEADGWLVKLDSLGYQQWSRTYGGSKWDGIFDVISLYHGGYILVGKTASEGKGGDDGWAIKTNNLGYVEWSRRLGGIKDDELTAVLPLGVGKGYLLTGDTQSMGKGMRDGWVTKVDSSGLVEWSRTYGKKGNDEISSVNRSIENNCYIFAGSSEKGNTRLAWIVEIDSNGVTQWDEFIEIEDYSHITAVKNTFGKGYVITGITRDLSGQQDGWMGLVSYEGKKKWIERFPGANEDAIFSVIPTLDSGFVLTGYTQSHGSYPGDAWMIKTNSLGQLDENPLETYKSK